MVLHGRVAYISHQRNPFDEHRHLSDERTQRKLPSQGNPLTFEVPPVESYPTFGTPVNAT